MLAWVDSPSASSGERSWCRDVLAQIRPEPLFRHQKVRQTPSIHRARPALLATSSGEIKDFAVFFDQRWGFGVQSLFSAIGLQSAQYGLGRILLRLLRG
jgi:hypothetical protein